MQINSTSLWKALFGLLAAASSALMFPPVQSFVANSGAAALASHPFLSGLSLLLVNVLALLSHKNVS